MQNSPLFLQLGITILSGCFIIGGVFIANHFSNKRLLKKIGLDIVKDLEGAKSNIVSQNSRLAKVETKMSNGVVTWEHHNKSIGRIYEKVEKYFVMIKNDVQGINSEISGLRGAFEQHLKNGT